MESSFKITPAVPKNESGLAKMIMLGEFIRQIWVKMLNAKSVQRAPAAERLHTGLQIFLNSLILKG